MRYQSSTVDEYIEQLPKERQEVIEKLRETILTHLDSKFEEKIQYDMISYVVPKSIYPEGYHVDPNLELGFLAIASQKNHIAIYHNGVYMFDDVREWFEGEYPKHMTTKLDMGKSCIRFKNLKTIPYALIAELCEKLTVEEYVDRYREVMNQLK